MKTKATITGKIVASKRISVTCSHCDKECEITFLTAGKKDHYSIECPHCEEAFFKQLPGEIIDGPHPR